MKRNLLAYGALALAMAAQASAVERAAMPAPKSAIGAIGISNGRNMPKRTATTPTRMPKSAVNASATQARAPRSISLNGIRRAPRFNEGDATALFAEGFESCTTFSGELPEGWSREGNIVSTLTEDHWYAISKAYAQQWFFPVPAEGDMMMTIFYDEYFKDETLVTPQISIPEDGDYELSFWWYTTPVWLYAIDRDHIDFDNGQFTNREQIADFEVLAREPGGEWQKIFSLEELFADMSYGELSELQYSELQQSAVSMAGFEGKNVELGFRYWSTDGDALFLDGIRIGLEAPDARYMSDPSVLYYGISPDDEMEYLTAEIEFRPVGYPVSRYNDSDNDGDVSYSWLYQDVDEDGEEIWRNGRDPEMLEVTYRPDYSDESRKVNNAYYLPELTATATNGASTTYKGRADMLQAGGTTEVGGYPEMPDYRKYTAFSFDVTNERLGWHVEGSDELGIFAEPIFGYDVNHDAWWEGYSYPDGAEGRYSYVDGFANLIIPHPEAPMVVKGATAWAYGTIYPEAEFTCNVYIVDEEGIIVETPIATAKLSGKDVTTLDSGLTRKYLVMNFSFPEPLVFSAEQAGLGYMVEVSGYHDEKIEYFAPLQSLEPNEHEWCLGFYHHYWPYNESLTEAMSYVAFFTDDMGRDMYNAFAIGLDAHYPWLEADNRDIEIGADGTATLDLRSYWRAGDCTVNAPEWLSVDLKGRYEMTANFSVSEPSGLDRTAQVTITAPGVSRTLNVIARGASAISQLEAEVCSDIYTIDGRRVDGTPAPGIYLVRTADGKTRKTLVR